MEWNNGLGLSASLLAGAVGQPWLPPGLEMELNGLDYYLPHCTPRDVNRVIQAKT